jgi:hypothetical protein
MNNSTALALHRVEMLEDNQTAKNIITSRAA